MGYKIDLGVWSGIFAVPCDLVDRQLKLAGEPQLKALLYILRHSGRAVELSELAQMCNISEADASDAVNYWVQEGVIACHEGSLAPAAESLSPVATVPECPPESVPASAPITPTTEEPVAAISDAPKPKAKERIRYSYDECAQMIGQDSELRHMLGILEGVLAKNLNHTEISVFITLVKWYGLPATCVAMLVEYCHEIGKAGISYIETTGIGWVNEEINTIEQVDAKIKRLRLARSAWGRIRSLLDIAERAPTKKEQEFASSWINEWMMPDELITLAYERCVDSKGKLNMSYMNGILSNWHKNGILTAEQARSESAPEGKPAAKSKSTSGMYSATYDKDEIEAMLDDDWLDDA